MVVTGIKQILIRENITPRGDGNSYIKCIYEVFKTFIRENITPRGDGNFCNFIIDNSVQLSNKREYNSERRRKLKIFILSCRASLSIRENITPRGDGNG